LREAPSMTPNAHFRPWTVLRSVHWGFHCVDCQARHSFYAAPRPGAVCHRCRACQIFVEIDYRVYDGQVIDAAYVSRVVHQQATERAAVKRYLGNRATVVHGCVVEYFEIKALVPAAVGRLICHYWAHDYAFDNSSGNNSRSSTSPPPEPPPPRRRPEDTLGTVDPRPQPLYSSRHGRPQRRIVFSSCHRRERSTIGKRSRLSPR